MTTKRTRVASLALLLWTAFLTSTLAAEPPQWIWHDNHGVAPAAQEVRYFRRTFTARDDISAAVLAVAADDEMDVYLNGKKIANVKGWSKAEYHDVMKEILPGEQNVLAIRGVNISGPAAIIALLDLTVPKAARKSNHQTIITDTNWVSTTTEVAGWTNLEFSAKGWTPAVSLGKVGAAPWTGDLFNAPAATPAESFTLLPGFKAQLLASAQSWQGSWICMTIDQKGRLIISPQEGTSNLIRVTLSKKGQVEKMETIDQPVGIAMGLLYANDSLYVNGKGPDGLGLYRLKDDRSHDKYEAPKLLRNIEGAAGEHGSHAVVLGPDKHIYIVSGNFTKVPKDISPESPHRNYAEDQLLPRAQDGNGFGNGVQPPGGFLLRMDADGKDWELFAGGMRNTYDFAFNPDGEIFGFDSDMEWDWGMPWYRPIRICHLVSGGDYGFREGTGKWPKYYPDSLPSAVDVGIGSPTGMKFGTDSKFPDKYKQALFALDWSYGRIFAVHTTPKGATYDATFETFLKGKPLNLTDIEFGHDGAMYFITGGRGTQSGLYRVTYEGEKMPADKSGPSKAELKAAASARKLRHKLEALQGKENPKTVALAWPHLRSDDRWIRYAARIAIESQPVSTWKDRALAETNANGAITALLALARCGGKETQDPLLLALAKFPLDTLSEPQKLEKLRVIELSFIRQGHPDAEFTKLAIEKLDRQYPAKSEWMNRELCELLIYLQAPDVVAKTLTLLDAAPTQEEQIHYMLHLRKLKTGWTQEQHEHYFSWFNRNREGELGEPTYHNGSGYYPWSKGKTGAPEHSAELLKWFTDAERDYGDGSSYPKFIAGFRRDAVESLSDDERAALASIITETKAKEKPATTAGPRKFVKEWTMAELQPKLDQVTKGRSFASGKSVFLAAQCMQCHRFANDGGAVGPELTAVSSRFGHRDILESIIEPSKVISEQYQSTLIIKKDGDDVTGRVVEEDDKKVVVVTNPLTGAKTEVAKSDIQTRLPSKLSPMPEGLVNTFSADEILDLIAYLESGGKETAPAFEKKNSDPSSDQLHNSVPDTNKIKGF